MYDFDKRWKLSGVQRIYINSMVTELGGFGSESSNLIWPSSVTTTPHGDLAVKDSGNQQIQIFSPEGRHKHGFSYCTESAKDFGDVVCTQDGLILVTDGSKGIKVFSSDGLMIHLLKSPNADWKHSYGIEVMKFSNIAVTDWTDGGKIHILDVDWRMNAILKMTVINKLHRPEHIAVNKNEDLLVTEGQLFGQQLGCCLKVLDSEHILRKTIGPSVDNKFHFVNPSGVCVDRNDNVFVADERQNCVVMFNPDSSLTAKVVTQDLEGPAGLAVTKEGLLAVADCYHHRVKLYKYR
ncbi:E3 ubiquitin-protein ligase TRIM32-like [Pleurodeles waltl]|uniref:E3 ubiquitin-protein ligase TRIM32-like n=1 Tax=Pleurodeles waltl TaxID=8319 RepID=UPI003709AB55